jgi:hypothetical protein
LVEIICGEKTLNLFWKERKNSKTIIKLLPCFLQPLIKENDHTVETQTEQEKECELEFYLENDIKKDI